VGNIAGARSWTSRPRSGAAGQSSGETRALEAQLKPPRSDARCSGGLFRRRPPLAIGHSQYAELRRIGPGCLSHRKGNEFQSSSHEIRAVRSPERLSSCYIRPSAEPAVKPTNCWLRSNSEAYARMVPPFMPLAEADRS
jgi:hypothetical protein